MEGDNVDMASWRGRGIKAGCAPRSPVVGIRANGTRFVDHVGRGRGPGVVVDIAHQWKGRVAASEAGSAGLRGG